MDGEHHGFRARRTGTPGATKAMKPGDVVEVEVQGVGVLRNTVVAAPASN